MVRLGGVRWGELRRIIERGEMGKGGRFHLGDAPVCGGRGTG
jgi:hypothetical protein